MSDGHRGAGGVLVGAMRGAAGDVRGGGKEVIEDGRACGSRGAGDADHEDSPFW